METWLVAKAHLENAREQLRIAKDLMYADDELEPSIMNVIVETTMIIDRMSVKFKNES